MGPTLAVKIQEIGSRIRAKSGEKDVKIFRHLKTSGTISQWTGRLILLLLAWWWPNIAVVLFGGWFVGMALVAFSLSLEAQLNHSVMHGAYIGLPGAEDLLPDRYETLAIPFQSITWGDAHRIHHAYPSILNEDPDTFHPLFRVHAETRWRPWHLFNTFLGTIFVFECWAYDYNKFLKATKLRAPDDRREILKFSRYVAYQLVVFPLLAWPHWRFVLAANLVAIIVRNFVFVGLQTGSSVGHEVSVRHAKNFDKKSKERWYRFQVESSKNFVLHGYWKFICGGLDRHIEHHLFPKAPPTQLHEFSAEVKHLCDEYGVRYQELPSFWATLKDSVSYLWKLSRP